MWALDRGRGDNPLAVATSFWRSSGIVRAWVILQWFAAGGANLTVLALYLSPASSFTASHPVAEMLRGAWFASILLLPPLNLLVFSRRWRSRRWLEDLILTRLTPREMAYGSVATAVGVSMIVPLGLALAHALFGLCGHLLARRVAVDYYEAYGANVPPSLLQDSIRSLSQTLEATGAQNVLLSGLLVLWAVAAVCVTLKVWFYLWSNRVLILVAGPAIFLAYFLCYLMFIGQPFDHASVGPEAPLTALYFAQYFLTGLLVLHLMVSAGRFAPTLFLRNFDLEPYIRYTIVGHEGIRWYRRELRTQVSEILRAAFPRRFRLRLAVPAGFWALYTALVCAVLPPWLFSGFAWSGLDILPMSSLMLFAFSFFLFVQTFLRKARKEKRLLIVSGAPIGTFLAVLWLPGLIYVGFFALSLVVLREADLGIWEFFGRRELTGWSMALAGLLWASAAFAIWSHIAVRGRLVALVHSGVAVACWLPMVLTVQYDDIPPPLYLAFIVLLYATPALWQSIFERTVRGLPFGEVWTAPPN